MIRTGFGDHVDYRGCSHRSKSPFPDIEWGFNFFLLDLRRRYAVIQVYDNVILLPIRRVSGDLKQSRVTVAAESNFT